MSKVICDRCSGRVYWVNNSWRCSDCWSVQK